MTASESFGLKSKDAIMSASKSKAYEQLLPWFISFSEAHLLFGPTRKAENPKIVQAFQKYLNDNETGLACSGPMMAYLKKICWNGVTNKVSDVKQLIGVALSVEKLPPAKQSDDSRELDIFRHDFAINNYIIHPDFPGEWCSLNPRSTIEQRKLWWDLRITERYVSVSLRGPICEQTKFELKDIVDDIEQHILDLEQSESTLDEIRDALDKIDSKIDELIDTASNPKGHTLIRSLVLRKMDYPDYQFSMEEISILWSRHYLSFLQSQLSIPHLDITAKTRIINEIFTVDSPSGPDDADRYWQDVVEKVQSLMDTF